MVLLVTEIVKHLNSWIRTAQAESVGDFLADKIHKQAAELDFAYYESPEYHDLMERQEAIRVQNHLLYWKVSER